MEGSKYKYEVIGEPVNLSHSSDPAMDGKVNFPQTRLEHNKEMIDYALDSKVWLFIYKPKWFKASLVSIVFNTY